ncbi:hypothetical protein MKW98_001905 [Papaver atlanticum]|uniref:Uncharacterized protein n=1 Tax=Papaver atlanticum TaxID=357466 RepID=A0AAD4T4P3_9MAGN|nr:hypothetical protein MKW98_001905 [Papaver atlanticum]
MFGVTSCVVYDNVSMAQKYPQQWEWTLAPSVSPSLGFKIRCLFRNYTEMQRKLCSDGKTWKGDMVWWLIAFEDPTMVLNICSMFLLNYLPLCIFSGNVITIIFQ